MLSALNRARQRISEKGYFEWDKYMGSIITVPGVNSYALSPLSSNYAPVSRNTAKAGFFNVIVYPCDQASYDDRFEMARCVGIGPTPAVAKTSLSFSQSRRVSASVWLKASADKPPGNITISLADSDESQLYTRVITGAASTPQRYGICGYFNFSSIKSTCTLKISWTNPDGVVWLDGWQIEDNDWPSEMIINKSETAAQARERHVDPLTLNAIAPYRYNQNLTWRDVPVLDTGISMADHYRTTPGYSFFSLTGNQLNLAGAPELTNFVYRACLTPPQFKAGDEVIDMPYPYVNTLLAGVIAYTKASIYDISSNKEVEAVDKKFENYIEEHLISAAPAPSWFHVHTVNPVMMR